MLKQKAKILLEKVAVKILEEPARLVMDDWGIVFKPECVGSQVHSQNDSKVPACRTQGCIAGWTIFLGRPNFWKKLLKVASGENGYEADLDDEIQDDNAADYAQNLLGISQDQADRLFYLPNWGHQPGWPNKFADAYNRAKTDKQRAKVTAARIRFFIQTDGTDGIKEELQAA
jgi:hypothetical protein